MSLNKYKIKMQIINVERENIKDDYRLFNVINKAKSPRDRAEALDKFASIIEVKALS